ncbi:COG3143: Chemotaxis protein [hydrothermal vent metagenome]|uniref:COG3143: Chemotaxis protein n=1 Tax=hydrothermal vent metagenome TaxID=652676 RepID=A0A3B0TKM3_9ZZZZ
MSTEKKPEAASDDAVVQSILDLGERLKKSPGGQMTLTDVIGVAELLTSSLQPLLRRIDVTLHQELRGILLKIETLRHEIAKVHADDISANRIPEMGKELSEVVRATEDATNSIMSAAELVLASENKPEAEFKALVADEMMKIFEACSFQDITGQRVTKVVETVEVIEERINILCEMMDGYGKPAEHVKPVLTKHEQEKKDQLLSGPTSGGADQAMIDAMF